MPTTLWRQKQRKGVREFQESVCENVKRNRIKRRERRGGERYVPFTKERERTKQRGMMMDRYGERVEERNK